MNAVDIAKILDELTQRLSGPASEIWTVLVRQSYIEGIIGVICGLGSITFLVCAVVKWPLVDRTFRKAYVMDLEMPLAILTVVSLAICIISIIFLPDNIARLINPLYYALKNLGRMLK